MPYHNEASGVHACCTGVSAQTTDLSQTTAHTLQWQGGGEDNSSDRQCFTNFPDHRDTVEGSVMSRDPSQPQPPPPPPRGRASKNSHSLFQSILHSEALATKRRNGLPNLTFVTTVSVSSGPSLICSRGQFGDLH